MAIWPLLLTLLHAPVEPAEHVLSVNQWINNGEAEYYLNGQLHFSVDQERGEINIQVDLDHLTTATADAYWKRETGPERARAWDENYDISGPHADGDAELSIQLQLPDGASFPDLPRQIIKRGRVVAHDGRLVITDLTTRQRLVFTSSHRPGGKPAPAEGTTITGMGHAFYSSDGPPLAEGSSVATQ